MGSKLDQETWWLRGHQEFVAQQKAEKLDFKIPEVSTGHFRTGGGVPEEGA